MSTIPYGLKVMERCWKRQVTGYDLILRYKSYIRLREILAKTKNRNRWRTSRRDRQAGGHWFEPSTAHYERPANAGFLFAALATDFGAVPGWCLSDHRLQVGTRRKPELCQPARLAEGMSACSSLLLSGSLRQL